MICFCGIARLVEGQFGFGQRHLCEAHVQGGSEIALRESAHLPHSYAVHVDPRLCDFQDSLRRERSVVGLLNLQ